MVLQVCLKLLWERPDERFNTEECSVRLTVEPIKLHINQVSLIQAFRSMSFKMYSSFMQLSLTKVNGNLFLKAYSISVRSVRHLHVQVNSERWN